MFLNVARAKLIYSDIYESFISSFLSFLLFFIVIVLFYIYIFIYRMYNFSMFRISGLQIFTFRVVVIEFSGVSIRTRTRANDHLRNVVYRITPRVWARAEDPAPAGAERTPAFSRSAPTCRSCWSSCFSPCSA